jgi:putative ABC transport system substrate-binding protein
MKHRLPATYWATEFVEIGGLMTYGATITDLYRRAATYVDKSSRALSQPIFQLSSRQNLSWSLI